MKIGNERLLKLATHLESGKLGHEVFDFEQWNDAQGPRCGTCGCAIGECPIAFPDEWGFDAFGVPELIGEKWGARNGSRIFFELTEDQMEHLFLPESQMPHLFGGVDLNGLATAAQVAANIRAFVEKRQG